MASSICSDDVPGLGITIKEDALKNFTVIE